MGRRVRKCIGYVHFRRIGAIDPKREKVDYGRADENGYRVLHLPKDSNVQLADLLMVPYLHKLYMYVVGVERDKKKLARRR